MEDGSGFSPYAARHGENPDPDEFPERKRGVQDERPRRRGAVRQFDDELDDVVPPEERTPEHRSVSAAESAASIELNARGRAMAQRGLGVLTHDSIVKASRQGFGPETAIARARIAKRDRRREALRRTLGIEIEENS